MKQHVNNERWEKQGFTKRKGLKATSLCYKIMLRRQKKKGSIYRLQRLGFDSVKPPSHRRATSVRPFSDKFWPDCSDIAEIQKQTCFCDCAGDPWALSRRPEIEISANFMAISSVPWPTYASSQQPCCTHCMINSYLRQELRDHSTMLRWPRQPPSTFWVQLGRHWQLLRDHSTMLRWPRRPPSTLWAPHGRQWRLLRDPSWTRSMIYIKRWFCCSSITQRAPAIPPAIICDLWVTIGLPWRCLRDPWETIEHPFSDLISQRPCSDYFEPVQKLMATTATLATSERP